MGRVSIVKIYGMKESLHNSIELIGGLNSFFRTGDTVLIKPNLNDFVSFTSPDLVASFIELLFDNNIKDIFIAESTFGNAVMTEKHFKATGYLELAKRYNITIVNINKSRPVKIKVTQPVLLDTLKIGEEVEKTTKIVNFPVMKVHYATGVTLCMKNLKGLLSREEKIHFHEMGLEKSIVDLNNTIPVALNILDGSSCMESMGPKGGDVFNLNILVAGSSPAEVDYVALKIMGFNPADIIHLNSFIKHNRIDVNDILTCGEEIKDVYRPFKKAEMKMHCRNNFVIHNINACSACVNALLLSMKFLDKDISGKFDIYIGQKYVDAGELNKSIGFGNCCKKKNVAIKIKGCPPYPFLLKHSLSK